LVTPAYDAEIPTFESRFVVCVAIVNVADVAPAGTTMLAGNVASDDVLRNDTVTPAAGAADDSFTVALTEAPPTTLVAASVSVASAGAGAETGLIMSVVDFCTPA
jgi:hypothetical protein